MPQNKVQPTQEFMNFLSMNYEQLVEALNNKYGKVQEPYFLKDSSGKLSKSQNKKILRSNEGLEIHHVAENKYLALSSYQNACEVDYKYQQPEYLVYANQLEHALLHAKIIVEFDGVKDKNHQVGYGGFYSFLIPLMNDFYSGWTPAKPNENAKLLPLLSPEQKQNYLMLIKYLVANHKDSTYLYSSLNSKFGLWSQKENIGLYKAFASKQIGAKPFNKKILEQNDIRMKQNQAVKNQGRVEKALEMYSKPKKAFNRWIWLAPAIVLGIGTLAVLIVI